jgi:hypothetical protein
VGNEGNGANHRRSARSGSDARGKYFVTGVSYSDHDGNAFYSIGEGRGDLVVTAAGTSVTSWATGGYTLEMAPGANQTITLSGAGLTGLVTVTADITNQNLKLDVVNGTTLLTSGSITVEGPVTMIKIEAAADATIYAAAGNQVIQGNSGNDVLNGGDGDDQLFGGFGIDSLNGNTGNDRLQGDGGSDFIDGGEGSDTAVFTGALSEYVVKRATDGSFRVLDRAGDTDIIKGVEFFEFKGVRYQWDLDAKALKPAAGNVAPSVNAAQAVSTNEGVAKSVTVTASDPDGDVLAYTAGAAAHGSITGGSSGVFTYTPTAGYSGTDSFVVSVNDGKGHIVTQTVSVTIVDVNVAPVANAAQAVSAKTGTTKQIVVKATDADGDALSFTTDGANNGSVTGGTGGIFTYKSEALFTGQDSFTVQISDGNGHTVNQTVSINVEPAASSGAGGTGAGFKLYLSNGLVDQIGGSGQVVGTNGFQDITILPSLGDIVFDASFNKGGDVIRLPGLAAEYTVALVGSMVEFVTTNSTYSIPIGSIGTLIVFEDGVRKLVINGLTNTVKLGSQSVTQVANPITAPTDNSPIPGGANDQVDGRVFLANGADVALMGNNLVFGTTGAEKIYYLGGELELDPTFNRGGDTLFLPRSIDHYSAYRSGSVLILLSDDGVIHIPVGSTGMTLNFDGNAQTLRVNTATNLTMIGDIEITSISETDPDHLGDFNEVSIDRGTPAVAVTITLEDGADHVLTEDANADTNVIVRGFDLGDIIQATGGTADDYSFSRGDSDGDSVADDMTIIYRTASTDNLITIIDAFSASNSVIVFDFQTAAQAFGGEFMTFA